METNLDYRILLEKYSGLIYLDPRKGSGIIAIDSLELIVELDLPFIYSHDKVPAIVKLAKKHDLTIEKFENLSRAGTVKTELLIHNLNEKYTKREVSLTEFFTEG